MRFGGHETFTIREGWLHKGLRLLAEDPARLVDEHAADWLGVGQNMAKSIRHWLIATGLARTSSAKTSAKAALEMTPLGQLVWRRDRYFSELGTWWALHINLVNAPEHAASWAWFFNTFHQDRFDRAVCLEGLNRHLQLAKHRLPSPKTLERDLACLLSTYARTFPPLDVDPEEGHDCPFRELGLLSHFRASGYYQFQNVSNRIAPHLFGYALAIAFPDAAAGDGTIDVPLHDATRQPGGPARVFGLTSESLFEVATRAEETVRDASIAIAGLAGQRVLRVRRRQPLDWLERFYRSVSQKDRHVA